MGTLPDGVDVRTMPLADILALIHGPVGQPVTLTLTLEGTGTRDVTLTRATLQAP